MTQPVIKRIKDVVVGEYINVGGSYARITGSFKRRDTISWTHGGRTYRHKFAQHEQITVLAS